MRSRGPAIEDAPAVRVDHGFGGPRIGAGEEFLKNGPALVQSENTPRINSNNSGSCAT